MAEPDVQVPAHEIVVAQTEKEIQDCFDVRVQVFHHEQKFPLETEFDSMEDVATHFLLRLVPSLVPIGTIRGYKQPGSEYYKLSRLAVLEPYRRFRFGKSLVLALHDWVWKDASLAVISTRAKTQDDGTSGRMSNESPIDSINTGHVIGTESGEKVVEIVLHSQMPVKGFYVK